ncbi:SMI1/KNR4 family protein [Sporosarcina highlanderae]|uniref:SMI1/KNR4 family protein n=1 Tax=Sporosarcina highlanderae TaxID=3035916 RepID=A0ABT8JTX9_9BACL|nr:SMI1/KNR4 family protein [Sporosarcina highlanderae]MDN4608565.1 SMI1/KNR4 family protein [Sporosarcina highlanderae]
MQHIFCNETMNKPATDEEITRVEQTLGRKLPSDFIQLLKIANGGIVKDTHQAFLVDFPIESGDHFILLEEIMGANEEGLMLSDYFIEEWGLPGELVLFSGSGHAWVGFNYENREIPNVAYVEPDEGNGNNFHVLADTFTEFMSKLTAAV